MQARTRILSAGVLMLMCTADLALARGGSDPTRWLSLRNNASLNQGSTRPTPATREKISETMKHIAVQLQAGALTPAQAKQLSETLSHIADMLEQ
jgi:hypothetical protein